MKLIYRGASYEFNPSKLEMVNAGITARYRGVSYSVRYPRNYEGDSSPMTLKYRGVTYSSKSVTCRELETPVHTV